MNVFDNTHKIHAILRLNKYYIICNYNLKTNVLVILNKNNNDILKI